MHGLMMGQNYMPSLYRITLTGFFGFIILHFLGYPETENSPELIIANQDPYDIYISALGAQNAAMRRARLQDFLRVHPNHVRSYSAQAQLNIINSYEIRDWNYVTQIAYKDNLSHEARLEEIENYSQRWGANLLGGRSQAIEDLTRHILALPDRSNRPSRRLRTGDSPISAEILDSRLLGEPPREIVSAPIYRPVTRAAITPQLRKDTIIAPKVRRQITPRYPRKALNRNIEAQVTLRINIDEKGRVKLAELVDVTAPRYEKDFVQAARRAALRTRYEPQTINGKAVATSGLQKKYSFKTGG